MKHRTIILAFVIACFTAVPAQARYLQMQQQYGYVQNRPPAISPTATIQHVGVRPVTATVAPRQTIQPTVHAAALSSSLHPVAQFKSQPLQLKQYQDGMNLYQYCKSVPVNYVDPSGLTTITEYHNPGDTGHWGIHVDGRDYDFGPIGPPLDNWGTHLGQAPWHGAMDNKSASATTYALKLKKKGRMHNGPNAGKRCCKLTLRNAGICVKYMALQWDGDLYLNFTHHCRTFVNHAKMGCCLKRN